LLGGGGCCISPKGKLGEGKRRGKVCSPERGGGKTLREVGLEEFLLGGGEGHMGVGEDNKKKNVTNQKKKTTVWVSQSERFQRVRGKKTRPEGEWRPS